jgi:hypothetical protein
MAIERLNRRSITRQNEPTQTATQEPIGEQDQQRRRPPRGRARPAPRGRRPEPKASQAPVATAAAPVAGRQRRKHRRAL